MKIKLLLLICIGSATLSSIAMWSDEDPYTSASLSIDDLDVDPEIGFEFDDSVFDFGD